MCGRISLSEIDRFFIRYSIQHPILRLEPHYNISPGMMVPVVIRQSPNQAVLMRWGLVPHWAKDPKIGYRLINARAETVLDKPAFRTSLLTRRCLVPVNAFFEWRRLPGGTSIPYAFRLRNEETFSLAGLFDVWHDVEGHELKTFTILTCAANELMAPIHNRMPVILKRQHEDTWLDPRIRTADALIGLLWPFPPTQMRAVRVSTLVNKPENDTPEILRPEEAPPATPC